uniref:Uncharacterized protein n=1 Tax=Strigamia maritima TaxID=126957 RepID=T1IRI6_STRMM
MTQSLFRPLLFTTSGRSARRMQMTQMRQQSETAAILIMITSWQLGKNGWVHQKAVPQESLVFIGARLWKLKGCTGSKNHRIQKSPDPKITRSKNHRIQKSPDPKITGSKNHRIQKSPDPKSPDPKITGFRMPNFTEF